ncbi:DinB family protein [Streptomyces sp. RB6PN25]|uniref:DinB family protein n=1 Tax=Streptomyces humicola TaxID=2953240 RepID=A0ABT1Q682_9ACTN|nr:DinB family protein [Streptomyces humicola]MCQ4084880.1 DinB family protein [Streptomyces humicola]
MTDTQRTDPPLITDERTMLESWLDFHRETLAMKCEGLTDEELRRTAVPPSDLSLLGLVRHMAEVERGWFRRVLAGEEVGPIFFTDEDPDGDFHTPEKADAAQDFAVWHAEIEQAKQAARDRSLDDTGQRRGRRDGRLETFSLRWIYVHMIEEYARHNGHADLIRECIDGTTGV